LVATLQEDNATYLKDNERMVSLLKRKDDETATLEAEIIKLKEEARKLREEAKQTPKPEENTLTASLKKEVNSLREQMSKLIAGKWTRDKVADSLLQPEGYAVNASQPQPGSGGAQGGRRYSFEGPAGTPPISKSRPNSQISSGGENAFEV